METSREPRIVDDPLLRRSCGPASTGRRRTAVGRAIPRPAFVEKCQTGRAPAPFDSGFARHSFHSPDGVPDLAAPEHYRMRPKAFRPTAIAISRLLVWRTRYGTIVGKDVPIGCGTMLDPRKL